MNIISKASSAASLNARQFNNDRISEAFSKGRKIKEPPLQQADNITSQLSDMFASDFSSSNKSITKRLTDRMPETTTPIITIMDSGESLDIRTAWGEIEHYLNHLIGLSPEHLQEAQHNLQELTVNKFQYLEDLVDHLVSNLNEQEGTQYPLTDEIGDDSEPRNGAGSTLYRFTKYAVAALASQSALNYLAPMASAAASSGVPTDMSAPPLTKIQTNYEFFADYTPQISIPDIDSPHTLTDMCRNNPPGVVFDDTGKLRPLKNSNPITGGSIACLPEIRYGNLTLAIPNSNEQNSISVSTGYGTGNLKLSLNNGAITDPGNPVPGRNSNAACAILKNPDQYWSFLTIKGNANGVVLAVDFNTDKCRTPFNFGVGSDRPKPVLTDTCATEKPVNTGQRHDLKVRKAVCLASNKENQFITLIARKRKNVAITTGQGSGELLLSATNLYHDRDGSKKHGVSTQVEYNNRPGNHDCIILDSPNESFAYITTSGKAQNASLVVDYNSDTCRLPVRPGFTRETNDRSQGFPYKSSHLLIYKLAYADAEVNWPDFTDDLEQTNEFYRKQAYDDFYVSWDVIETRIDTSVDTYKDGKSYTQWQDRVFEAIRSTGVDPDNPGRNKMIMVVTPKSEGSHSFARSNMIVLDDGRKNETGIIAHHMGYAMGLRGSGAIDGGPQVIRDMPDDDSWYNCENRQDCIDNRDRYLKKSGNLYDLTGPRGHYDLKHEMSLFDKSFFGWVDPDTDAPLAKASGTYRIHAFDQGKKPDGPMGLRIQSGDQRYTYWLEYRTTGEFADNTRQGVVVNLEGYAQPDHDPRYWDKKSYLLDMTPDSARDSWWGNDFEDATLLVGQSYTDKWGGFTMTPRLVGGRENSPDAWIEVDVVTKADALVSPGGDMSTPTTSTTASSITETNTSTTSTTAPGTTEIINTATSTTAPGTTEIINTATSSTAPDTTEIINTATSSTAPDTTEIINTATSSTAPGTTKIITAATSTTAPGTTESITTATSTISPGTTKATLPTPAIVPTTPPDVLHDVAVIYIKKEGETPQFDIDELHGRISNQANSLIRSNSYHKEGFGKVSKFGWYDVVDQYWNAKLNGLIWSNIRGVVQAKRNGSLDLNKYGYVLKVWDDKQQIVDNKGVAYPGKDHVIIDGTYYPEKSLFDKFIKPYDMDNHCFYEHGIYSGLERCYTNPVGENLREFEGVIFHEFLHTKRLAHHSLVKYCENVLLGRCNHGHYNMFDALSSARFYGNSLNAHDKHRINWLTDEDIVFLDSASGSHEITLNHLNTQGSGKKAVKINFKKFMESDIWLEFRQPTKLDYGLFNPVFDKVTSGLLVFKDNTLLDATPKTPAIDYQELTDVAITDHFSFDPLGLTIDIMDVDRQNGTIRFRVDLNTTKPTRNQPSVRLSQCDYFNSCRITRGGTFRTQYRAVLADIGYGPQNDIPWGFSLSLLPAGITWTHSGVTPPTRGGYFSAPQTVITFSADDSVRPGTYRYNIRFINPEDHSKHLDLRQWLTVDA